MKRMIVVVLLAGMLVSVAGAQDLNGFADDFEALVTGITRDVAPNLQMAALSGTIVADASIDTFMLFLPGVGVTMSGGLGTIMEPGAHTWSTISLPSVIDAVVTDAGTKDLLKTLEYGIFPYPMLKLGAGFAIGKGFDVIVSGMYLPAALTDFGLGFAGDAISGLGITLETLNIGATVRKVILKDSGPMPALSLGALYNYGSFTFGVASMSLAALADGGVDVGGMTLDLTGTMGFETSVHNFGLELHASKRLLFFTPYAKLSGIYQYAVTNGTTNLLAKVGTVETPIVTDASETIANFSTLATLGFTLFVLNVNVVIDLAQAQFDAGDYTLASLSGQGISLNAGICIKF